MPVICFVSPKGGVGKTTLAANVASRLAQTGQRTLALDLDPQNALRLHFGIPVTDGAGFTSHIAHGADWRGARRRTLAGVELLPFGECDLGNAVALTAEIGKQPALLTEPIRQMRIGSDAWLVLDTPPGPSSQLSAVLPVVDLLITVLLVDAASVSQIPTVESGASYGVATGRDRAHRLAFVLNQFDPRNRLSSSIREGAVRHLGNRLLGIIYRDENVAEAAAAQQLVADYMPASKAAHDFADLTRAILARLRDITSSPPSPAVSYVAEARN